MHKHRLRQDEAANEKKNNRIGERRERGLRRCHQKHHRQHGPQDGGDRHGQRVRDPEDDDSGEDDGEPMRLRAQAGKRGSEERNERDGREDETGRRAETVEPCFGREIVSTASTCSRVECTPMAYARLPDASQCPRKVMMS